MKKQPKLIGEDSGTTFKAGDQLRLQLAEANPLTGALKFAPLDADGNVIEPRGRRPAPRYKRAGGPKKGKYQTSKRGRPGNIRHQGRKR